MEEYVKYDELYDSVLRQLLQDTYKKEYSKGWYLADIVKAKDDKWIVKWERNLLEKSEELK